jgi:hypothetical protein
MSVELSSALDMLLTRCKLQVCVCRSHMLGLLGKGVGKEVTVGGWHIIKYDPGRDQRPGDHRVVPSI